MQDRLLAEIFHANLHYPREEVMTLSIVQRIKAGFALLLLLLLILGAISYLENLKHPQQTQASDRRGNPADADRQSIARDTISREPGQHCAPGKLGVEIVAWLSSGLRQE